MHTRKIWHIFLVFYVFQAYFNSPKGSLNIFEKHKKLKKYWPYFSRMHAITTTYKIVIKLFKTSLSTICDAINSRVFQEKRAIALARPHTRLNQSRRAFYSPSEAS